MAEATAIDLSHTVSLLGAGVLAVPVFRKLGLGSVLGYLSAGMAIGPFGLRLIQDPETILHASELGVVLFLFLIGLEMRPQRLWSLRNEIFGLGVAQVVSCGLLLTLAAMGFGVRAPVAFIGAMGFVLSSTAVIMQMLEERNALNTPHGQRAVSILLLEDLAIVPLLAVVAVMASLLGVASEASPPLWQTVSIAVVAVGSVFVAGRYVLNPVFRFLAKHGGREVMTAAALLVVAAAAWVMQLGGLSMAMGAFFAGVLLSDSTFRHQIEADVEPFRAILLGLFFLSVGMSLDLGVVTAQWQVVLGGVALFMVVKAIGIYGVARLFSASHNEAVERAALFAQGGEFAFVLYTTAAGAGIFDARTSAQLTAIVVLSMMLTPLVTVIVLRRLARETPQEVDGMEGVERAENLSERVLIIGFGRFAQIVSQPMLAQNVDVSIIENDVEMIQAAGRFGFKVYYGDGTRLDVLRASGAERAEAVLVCVDKPEVADRIVSLVKAEFPLTKLFVRAYDRGHALRLIEAGVDYQLRETFESALTFGARVLNDLGFEEQAVLDTIEDVRRRDEERMVLQQLEGPEAGRALMRGNLPTAQPVPYVRPQRKSRALNDEAARLLHEKPAPIEGT